MGGKGRDLGKVMDDELKKKLGLGPTGDHPRGKLNEHDEGGLVIAVGSEGDCVRIEFGSPIAWLALPPAQAMALAHSIILKATALSPIGASDGRDAAHSGD